MNKQKDYTVCPNCGMLICTKLFNKHRQSCEKIKEQMPFILKEFNKRNYGAYRIARDRHLNFHCLSKQLKKLGVELNVDNNGKYPRQYSVNDNYFDNMQWEQYWLLGLLASDGYIEHDHYIGLSQSGDNGLQLITYVNQLLKNTAPIRHRKTKGQIAHQLYFSSPKIAQILKKYNIVSNKTYVYDLPIIPQQYIKPFLIGYIMGDGCISYTYDKIIIAILVSVLLELLIL